MRWVQVDDSNEVDGGYFQEDFDSTHCEHGTFIGYPGGPDYMCGYCEGGVSMAQLRREYRRQDLNYRRKRKQFFKRLKKIKPRHWKKSIIENKKNSYAEKTIRRIVNFADELDDMRAYNYNERTYFTKLTLANMEGAIK